MSDTIDHIALNKAGWDARTPLHLESDFYDMPSFRAGKTSLKEIELGLLGDIKGKKVLHLQCHFGQDSISLAKLGAEVTAVDLSPAAIDAARALAVEMNVTIRFICSDVMSPELLEGETFDLIYSTYGTICWHPDMTAWAQQVQRWMAPKARLMLIEFHPLLDMYDDDMEEMPYSYFNIKAVEGSIEGSYAKREGEAIPYVVWNHPISDVTQALIDQGLNITHLGEYNYSPYPCFAGMIEYGEDRHIIKRFGDRMPLVWSLVVTQG